VNLINASDCELGNKQLDGFSPLLFFFEDSDLTKALIDDGHRPKHILR
jgi:hypothetical protein